MAEAFIKGLLEDGEEIPLEIIKLNDEIRDLDERVSETMSKIHEKTLLYTKHQKRFTKEAKNKAFKDVEMMYTEAKTMSAQKIRIAQQMYNFIDEKINELDSKTSAFNQRMTRKNTDEQKKLNGTSQKGSGGTTPGRSVSRKFMKSVQEDAKKSRLAETEVDLMFQPIQLISSDLPVNPNEPTYCFCHQVSFGEMVGCDNPHCKYEWFHMQCIKMDKAPDGEWFCEFCRPTMKGEKTKKK